MKTSQIFNDWIRNGTEPLDYSKLSKDQFTADIAEANSRKMLTGFIEAISYFPTEPPKMKIESIQQANGFIIFENEFKICVRDSKEAAEWISKQELDKGGTGGAIYGPYKTGGQVYFEVYKDGALEQDFTIPTILIH